MKDRQFMVILALVVGAGLVLGLIASRVTGVGPASGATPPAAAPRNPNMPPPSTGDEFSDESPDTVPPVADVDSQDGEPNTPIKEPPEMKGPSSGDAPGTAAAPPAQPVAPTATLDTPLQ